MRRLISTLPGFAYSARYSSGDRIMMQRAIRLATDLRRGVGAKPCFVVGCKPPADFIARQTDDSAGYNAACLLARDFRERPVECSILKVEQCGKRLLHELEMEACQVARMKMRHGQYGGIMGPDLFHTLRQSVFIG